MTHDPPDGDRPLLLERVSSRLVQRLSNRTVLLLSGAGIVAVGFVDVAISRLAGFDLAITPLYLLPVGFAAWASGATVGLLFALYAAAVEGAAAWISARGTPETWSAALGVAMELAVFVGASYTIARLRWHLAYERHLSHTDPVTGIGNLRSFEDAAQRELSRMARRTSPVSVAYFDVDHFKDVNDRRGHLAGDQVLQQIGELLRREARSVDTVGRFGGEEFVLVLPETALNGAIIVAERVRQRVQAHNFGTGTEPIRVTVSIGVASVPDDRATSPLTFLALADAALYRAKAEGRNVVRS